MWREQGTSAGELPGAQTPMGAGLVSFSPFGTELILIFPVQAHRQESVAVLPLSQNMAGSEVEVVWTSPTSHHG